VGYVDCGPCTCGDEPCGVEGYRIEREQTEDSGLSLLLGELGAQLLVIPTSLRVMVSKKELKSIEEFGVAS
jgi:hypothetical protein